MSEATIEVNGEVYALTNTTMRDNTQTYTTAGGEFYAVQSGGRWLDAETSDSRARALVHNGALRCRVELGGLAYTGYVMLTGWSAGFSSIRLRVEDIKPIPATPAPTLDELTDPADLDWGALRSAADDRRDWREAWGIVGTDHTGDATPGEVYLLSVARHKSATAAALYHWRKAEMESGTIFIGADAARAWQRIKGIAAWESSARAQYDERGVPYAAMRRWREEFRNEFSTPHTVNNPFYDFATQARLDRRDDAADELLNALRQIERATQAADTTVRPTHMWIDEATLDALRQRGEDDAMTRGNGRGVQGVLNNPFLTAAAQRGEITGTVTIPPSTSATIVAALEQYASMTGNTMNVQGNGRGGIVVTPRNTNPAPRGPQTRKRR